MKQRLQSIQNNLKNNPEFQAKLQDMKPKKSFFGFFMVILVFFIPEVVSLLWSVEINGWMVDSVQSLPKDIGDLLKWATKEMFNGEVSWINVGLGVAFLVWLFKD